MILWAVRKLRILLLVLGAFLAIGGLFPAELLEIVGIKYVNDDAIILLGLIYAGTLIIFIVWLILAVFERKLVRSEVKTLDQ